MMKAVKKFFITVEKKLIKMLILYGCIGFYYGK